MPKTKNYNKNYKKDELERLHCQSQIKLVQTYICKNK